MKKVHLNQIKDQGLSLPLNAREDWVITVMNNAVGENRFDPDSIEGRIDLHKTNQYVNFAGNIKFARHPLCARCGKTLSVMENIALKAHLVPLCKSPAGKQKKGSQSEQAGLTKEDLEFCFYENDEIIVDGLFNDEIALALPYNDYCQDEPTCQTVFPQDKHSGLNDKTDPRWGPLKNLKFPEK